jgi:cytosine/adenosine deaminase-related metal-dependent hydrolase
MYQGTRLAAAEAINSGITFVHDWCHNIRSPADLEQDLRALRESGLRARFSYGAAQGMPNNQGIVLADLERLARDWPNQSNDGLIALGLAWRGMGGNNPATAIPAEIYKAEIEAARKLGLPISVHASGSRPAIGQVATIAKAGLLAKDMQIIHGVVLTPEEIEAIKAAGASVSLSPTSELRIGFGLPQTANVLAADIPVGLSVDTVELTGNADMFGIMKFIQNIEEREERERVQAHRPPRARTPARSRAHVDGDRRQRSARSKLANGPTSSWSRRATSTSAYSASRAHAGDRGTAVERGHGRGRRTHSQAWRKAHRHEHRSDRG